MFVAILGQRSLSGYKNAAGLSGRRVKWLNNRYYRISMRSGASAMIGPLMSSSSMRKSRSSNPTAKQICARDRPFRAKKYLTPWHETRMAMPLSLSVYTKDGWFTITRQRNGTLGPGTIGSWIGPNRLLPEFQTLLTFMLQK